MSTPTSVPTPGDVAARLGLTDGSWLGENLEEVGVLADHMAARGVTAQEVVDAIRTPGTADPQPSAAAQAAAGERHRSWSEQETRELLDRAQAALDDADSAAAAGERWAVAGRRVEAAVLVAMATARSVGQVASAGHRCASALHDVAAAVRQRGSR
ncbi:hypothetical protein WDZ16_13075 [Pseudokineococcus marinus]|uniref:Uncharacterized protein n=1 Tax=Pseudokineococcus marinus TaxID=351215 RepID=A0A849BVT2_9ACTN|nr:hypothetical protein [Pseudokineococcus marinus]NNH21668.1 hypothetical protein [Pseudokineococcus marinus]